MQWAWLRFSRDSVEEESQRSRMSRRAQQEEPAEEAHFSHVKSLDIKSQWEETSCQEDVGSTRDRRCNNEECLGRQE